MAAWVAGEGVLGWGMPRPSSHPAILQKHLTLALQQAQALAMAETPGWESIRRRPGTEVDSNFDSSVG